MSETEDAAFHARLERLNTLLNEVQATAPPAVQAKMREVTQAILELHAVGIERLLRHIDSEPSSGAQAIDRAASDKIVSSMLLLHGLHPAGIDARVKQALADVRPYLNSHGGNVELLDISNGVVRLHLQGSCQGCPSSAMTLKQTIEKAIFERAPDVAAIEVEGFEIPAVDEPEVMQGHGVSLPILSTAR